MHTFRGKCFGPATPAKYHDRVRRGLAYVRSNIAVRPWIVYVPTANAQLFPRQKLTIEQHRIAMRFEASRGMCT
jgi:hypothetical protein